MASIQRRTNKSGAVSYRAQIRIKGFEPVGSTFKRKTDAKEWAAKTESAMKEDRYFPHREAKKHTVKEAIDKYLEDVMPHKKASTQESQKYLLSWWSEQLGQWRLGDVTTELITNKRGELKSTHTRQGKPRSNASCNRHIAIVAHVFAVAKKEWGWIQTNPFTDVVKLPEPKGRVRYLDDDERGRLLTACRASKETALYDIVVVAISTGMRTSEILGMKWSDVKFGSNQIILHDTKNGETRSVSIEAHAFDLLEERSKRRRLDTNLVFPGKSLMSGEVVPLDFRTAWLKVLKESKVEDFVFHDLRHCCASYLAQQGSSGLEIAEVLGHKTLDMVKRYSHLSPARMSTVVKEMNDRLFSNADATVSGSD